MNDLSLNSLIFCSLLNSFLWYILCSCFFYRCIINIFICINIWNIFSLMFNCIIISLFSFYWNIFCFNYLFIFSISFLKWNIFYSWFAFYWSSCLTCCWNWGELLLYWLKLTILNSRILVLLLTKRLLKRLLKSLLNWRVNKTCCLLYNFTFIIRLIN